MALLSCVNVTFLLESDRKKTQSMAGISRVDCVIVVQQTKCPRSLRYSKTVKPMRRLPKIYYQEWLRKPHWFDS